MLVEKEITRIHHWMIIYFPSSSAKWIHQAVRVTVHYAGDALPLINRLFMIEKLETRVT